MSTPFVNAQQLGEILDHLNLDGEFVASVLTDKEGLPLAKAITGERDLTIPLAAVVPLIQQRVQRSNERIGLTGTNEIVVNDDDGMRLVSRFFGVGDHMLILACLVPAKRPYRRVMNKAITAIGRLWRRSLSKSGNRGK